MIFIAKVWCAHGNKASTVKKQSHKERKSIPTQSNDERNNEKCAGSREIHLNLTNDLIHPIQIVDTIVLDPYSSYLIMQCM